MVQLKEYLLPIILTIIIGACTDSNNAEESRLSLKGEQFKVTQGDLYVADFLAVTDSMIVFSSYDRNGNVKVYKKDDCTISESYTILRKGRSEREINFVLPKFINRNIMAFDKHGANGISKFLKVKLSVEKPINWSVEQTTWLNDIQTFGDFTVINDSTIIAIAGKWKSKEILSSIDLKNNLRTPLKFWIEDKQQAPDQNKQVLYSANAQIALNSDRTKLVYACGEGRFMDIMGFDGQNITSHNVVLNILPEYVYNGRKTSIRNKEYRGIKIATTDRYIYVTYSNTVENKEYKGYPGYFKDRIDVYDWDGNIIQRYETDQPFYNFIVSNDDSCLYTLSHDNETKEPTLLYYKL